MDWSYTELSNLVGQFLPHFHFPSIRKTIWLDFSNLDFAKTHVLLMVGCFAKYLQTQRLLNNFYCVIPRKIDVHRYMSRLDFYKMIGANVEELFTRQPSSGRFVEICQTNKDNTFDVVNKIVKVLETQFNDIDETVFWGISWSLNEVLDNIIIHANSIIGGYVIVQNYSDRVDIAICDCGVGIAANIYSRWGNLSQTEALEHAIQKGVTTNIEGAGAGLYYTKKIIEHNNGAMTIYSGAAQLIIEGKNIYSKEVPFFPGTMVYLSYNKNHTINHSEIWEEGIPATIDNYMCDDFELW